jgi:heat-inducible transcriptional repressor
MTMSDGTRLIDEMNYRSREVFRRVVEGYLLSGEPVGSRTLTRTMSEKVSAATIRNVMQDLEFMGLLDSPHVSAGRIPTQLGLRMFVDGILEIGDLDEDDRRRLAASTTASNESGVSALLDRVGSALSGLTHGASLVLAPKYEAPIRHVEFVPLAQDRALVVLVFADGHVENRVFTPPPGQTPSSLREAANFVNAVAEGRTISELRTSLRSEIDKRRAELDELARDLVESGLAIWEGENSRYERLIVRGRANLIDDHATDQDIERIRGVSRACRGRRGGADLHRLREQTLFTFRFLFGGLSIYERGP